MTFLSAGLLAGLLLATVPIIIHILNRRRFQVIDWPPMKYLKLTLKKNRRRIRIEQMILLAMRTLAVILLILAVARPVISQGALSKFVPGRARTSRVIVIDDSLSMGYTTAGRSAFQVTQNAAEDLLKAAGTQDSVTLLTTSTADHPLVKDGSMQDSGKYADLLRTLSQTDTPNNWATTFDAIRTALSTASFANKEVVVITDMRRSGWSSDVTRAANELASDRVPMRIIDVGDRRTENASLLKFELEDAIPLPDQPLHLTATIRNNTTTTIVNGQATLSVDGDARPVLLPEIPAGNATEVPLTVTINDPGTHTLTLSLSRDPLPNDDTRYLSINVRPTVSVLMIDGSPSPQPFESDTDFLALAYSVGARPWNVQRATEFNPRKFAPGSAEIPDVLVLANIPSLTSEQVTTLERLVQKGMGLMIFVGDQLDIDAYNQRLFREGKGLLPGKLNRPIDTPTAGLVVEKDPQSPLAIVAKLTPAALAGVRTRQYTPVENAAPGTALPEGVSVLARWNNAENPVAIMQKAVGKGRVLLFTTTANKKWTDWPVDRTYVLAVRAAALGIAHSQELGGAISAGETIRLPFEAGQAVIDPKIVTPGSKGPDIVDVDKGDTTVLRYVKTFRTGIYSLSWRDEKSKSLSAQFAVNPPPAESDLDPLTEQQLTELLGNLKPSIQRYDTHGVGLGQPPRELWRPLATILLALLAAEAAFAVWVGRER